MKKKKQIYEHAYMCFFQAFLLILKDAVKNYNTGYAQLYNDARYIYSVRNYIYSETDYIRFRI